MAGKLIDFRIQGDRMNTEFMEGDIITVDHDCKPQPNDFVIVVGPGRGLDRVTFGQLRKVGTMSYLHPLNPAYDDVPLTKKHKIMGKVVRRQKDY